MPIGAMSIKITGDISQFNKDIASVQKQLNASTKGLQTVARNMTSVGDSMTKGITVPIIAMGAILFKIGNDFHDAYSKIRIETSATGKELTGLQNDFKAVAKVAPSSFDDISTAIVKNTQKLGLNGKALQDLSVQELNLSRITKTDLNTNIDNAAKLFNSWEISTEKQSKTLDLMYRASKQTGIGIDVLMGSVADTGLVFRAMGFDIETSIELIAQLNKEGVDLSPVLVSMKTALKNMAKEGFTDPQEVLAMYIEKIKGAKTDIEAIGIAAELFGAKGGTTMAMAIREGKLNLDDLTASLKTGTDTINAAAKATEDWKEKLILLQHTAGIVLEPLATKVFDAAGRAIDGVTPKVEKLATAFGGLTPKMQDNLILWASLAAVIPVVGSGVGRTITFVNQLRNGLLTLSKAITASSYGGIGTSLFGAVGAGGLASAIVVVGGLINRLGGLTKAWATGELAAMSWSDKILEILNVSLFGLPEAMGKVAQLIVLLNTAFKVTIPVHDFKYGFEDMIKAVFEGKPVIEAATMSIEDQTKAYNDALVGITAYKTRQHEGIEVTLKEQAANIDNEAVLQGLMTQYDWTREKAHEYAIEQGLLQTATEDTTGATDEQTEADKELTKAKEALKQATDDLYGSLFNEWLLNADISEGLVAADEAYAEYTKALRNHGATSDETQGKLRAYIEILDGLTQTQIPELINKTGALTTEEIKMVLGMQAEIDKAEELGVLLPEDVEKVRKSINEKIQGSILKDFGDMHNKMTELGKLKIEPKIGLDTSEFYSKLRETGRAFQDAWNKYGNYAKGGIVGFSEGGLLDRILSASAGMNLPKFDNGGVLAILHPPEIVLNAKEAMQLVWNMANKPMKSEKGNGVVMNNTFNSPKPLTESEINRNLDIVSRQLGYRLGLN